MVLLHHTIFTQLFEFSTPQNDVRNLPEWNSTFGKVVEEEKRNISMYYMFTGGSHGVVL
jgi:hypothetical protein